MKDADLYWLAGLCEGEAYFGSRPDTGNARLSIEATDRDVIGRAATLLDGKVRARLQRNERSKPTFVVEVTGDKAIRAMEELLPFMGARRSTKIMEILYGANRRLRSTSLHSPPGLVRA